MLKPKTFFDNRSNTFSYVVADASNTCCIVVDPVQDFDMAAATTKTGAPDTLAAYLRESDLKVVYILETHVHADHVSGAQKIREEFGGQICIGAGISEVRKVFADIFDDHEARLPAPDDFDLVLEDGATLKLGAHTIRAISTPGHTPACMTYVIEDMAFVGDTLFMPDLGTARCDFPGGDAATLYRSIQKLLDLPSETRLFMCHDYGAKGRADVAYLTTVDEQRTCNIHVGGETATLDRFVKMRTQRDATLAVPKMLIPSIQVNIRAGKFPEPSENGRVYLKMPLDSV